jgi:hypothetical protein
MMTWKQMRCKEGLRAMEAAGTPLSVDGGVPVRELGEEMFTGTIEWVDGYMRASLKVTVIGLERSRGDEALEEVQESAKTKEPDESHAFRCAFPQRVNRMFFEEFLKGQQATAEKGSIEARGRITNQVDIHASKPG